MDLAYNDLTGGDFAGQNLTNSTFFSSTLTDADFRGADTRGIRYFYWSTAVVGNTIVPSGQIEGIELAAGQTLVVRDYDGNQHSWHYGDEGDQSPSDRPFIPPIGPIPIHVDDHFVIGPGRRLADALRDGCLGLDDFD